MHWHFPSTAFVKSHLGRQVSPSHVACYRCSTFCLRPRLCGNKVLTRTCGIFAHAESFHLFGIGKHERSHGAASTLTSHPPGARFSATPPQKKSFLWIHPSEVNLFIPAASARVDFATALIIGDEQQREPSFRHLEHKAGPFFPLSGNCTHKARGWFLCPHAQSVSLAALIRLECRSEQGSI